ncbi:MAG: hypothetical protein RLY16_1616 [Bacteroidota bacterium]|jgi:predicted 3-demethylubiquinone-9 3-methyltransferase (glyoxalase superfamily)
MANNTYPCIWMDGTAAEAANLYTQAFPNCNIISNNGMVVNFAINGRKIMLLNGGPLFKITPALSMMVNFSSAEAIESAWNQLAEGGKIMMPLNQYPWAEKYGWVVDRFGMTWQLMLGDLPAGASTVNPCFLFVGAQYGNAVAAMQHYAGILKETKIIHTDFYTAAEQPMEGKLRFGQFTIGTQIFNIMDGFGGHEFDFNEAVSIVVECENQDEIDHYWNELTKGGSESQCGWLKDQFGVSWQIIPKVLASLMSDPAKAQKVIQAFLPMKKMIIADLIAAAEKE